MELHDLPATIYADNTLIRPYCLVFYVARQRSRKHVDWRPWLGNFYEQTTKWRLLEVISFTVEDLTTPGS